MKSKKLIGYLFLAAGIVFVTGCTKEKPVPDTSANINANYYLVDSSGNKTDLTGPFTIEKQVPKQVKKQEPALDENGNPTKDEDGNPIMKDVVDGEGNPVMVDEVDGDGNPVMETKEEAVEKLPTLALQEGDYVPLQKDVRLADIAEKPHKELPIRKEVPEGATQEEIDAINAENAEIDQQIAEVKALNTEIDAENAEIKKDNEARKGYTFVGWFKDEAGEEAFNFDDKATKSTKIFGVFKKAEANKTLVSFRSENGTVPAFVEVETASGKIEQPANILSAKTPRKIINGWITPKKDESGNPVPYDFTKTLAENGGADALPITATWEEVKKGYQVVNFVTKFGQQNLPFQVKNGAAFPKDKLPTSPKSEEAGTANYASIAQDPEDLTDAEGKDKWKKFKNWTLDLDTEAEFNAYSRVKEDLTLNAVWEEKLITLTFTNNHLATLVPPLVKKIYYGIEFTDLTDAEKIVYQAQSKNKNMFKSWKMGGVEEFQANTAYYSNKMFYASYGDDIVYELSPEESTVVDGEPNLKLETTLEKITLVDGQTADRPATPKIKPTASEEQKDYVFAGWIDENGNEYNFDFDRTVNSKTELKALWKKPAEGSVIVSFVTDNSAAPSYKEVKPDETFKQPLNLTSKKTDPQQVFKGWKTSDGKDYDFEKTVAENGGKDVFPLEAQWEVLPANKVIVNFEDAQSQTQNLPIVLDKNTKVTLPNSPTAKEGNATIVGNQLFMGWKKDLSGSDYYNFDALVSDNITLRADWGSAFFTVEFKNDKLNKIHATVKNVKYNSTVISKQNVADVAPVGEAQFLSWQTQAGEEFDITSTKVTENLVIKPKWKETYYKFVFNPGKLPAAQIQGTNLAEVVLTENNAELKDFPNNTDWDTYEFISGKDLATISTSKGLTNPKYTGKPANGLWKSYTFTNWTDANQNSVSFNASTAVNTLGVILTTDFGDKVVKAIELTAQWDAVAADTSTVTLVNYDGNDAEKQIPVVTGGKVTGVDTSPTHNHYEFKGWFNESSFSTEADLNATINGDKRIYAKWEGKKYNVTFVSKVQNHTDLLDFGIIVAKQTQTVTYPAKATKPYISKPLPAHKMVWTSDQNCSTSASEYDFANTPVTQDITINLCDEGFNEKSILDQMRFIAKDNAETNNSPDYNYYVFPYEVTTQMYNKGNGGNYTPQFNVSYTQALAYVRHLNTDYAGELASKTTNCKFALPKEIEFRWAAMAGGAADQEYSGASMPSADMKEFVVHKDFGNSLQPVFPTRRANAYGLFDMSGNLAEMVTNVDRGVGGDWNIGMVLYKALLKPAYFKGTHRCDYTTFACNGGAPNSGPSKPDNSEATLGFRIYLTPANANGGDCVIKDNIKNLSVNQ